MNFGRLFLFLSALPLFAAGPDAVGMDPLKLAAIPKRMQAYVDQGMAAGFVTLVARHGHVVQLAATGYQDREAQTPMKTDSLFQIMSLTKPITCVGIMVLMEEGRLALIDPVGKYLPEFKQPITIRDLMTHTSGLPGSLPKAYDKNEHTLKEVVKVAAQLPLEFEPGSKWSYSNVGIATLGRIIEVVSGEAYERFIQERIFDPLAMSDTHYFLPAAKAQRLAAVYTDDHGSLRRDEADPLRKGSKYASPEGGLYSTASDIGRFYQMMLDKGSLNGRRVLSSASVELMTTVHTGNLKTGFSPGVGYGLGLSVVREPAGMFRLNSIGTFGHGGAYRTYGWADPAKDLIGVIMFQRTNGGGDVAPEINSFMQMAAAAIVH